MNTKKLYIVELRGLRIAVSGPEYGLAYVIASNPAVAYQKVRESLDKRDIGFPCERELKSVTLLAESVGYPDCQTILYL